MNKKQAPPLVIAIEGVDFSGKTTLAYALRDELNALNYRTRLLHDPKGTTHGKMIWETMLKLKKQNSHPSTEFFLFLAARNELIQQQERLERVDVLIFDRFIFSTIAYQLTDRPQDWPLFLNIHRTFSYLMPDLCIYCDIALKQFIMRQKGRKGKDIFDQMSQKRCQAIQTAYEQIFSAHWTPVWKIDTLSYACQELIKKITPLIHPTKS